jgi:hypothetical protein
MDEAIIPPCRKSCGTVTGGKSARLKPLKKVDHVVISLAEPSYREIIGKTRSNAVASPSVMDGTHY